MQADLSLTLSETPKTGFLVTWLIYQTTSWQKNQKHDKTNTMTFALSEDSHQHACVDHAIWSRSSLCAQWEAKDPRFVRADSEDSDQTISVFAWRTSNFVGFVVRQLKWKLFSWNTTERNKCSEKPSGQQQAGLAFIHMANERLLLFRTYWWETLYCKNPEYSDPLTISFYP